MIHREASVGSVAALLAALTVGCQDRTAVDCEVVEPRTTVVQVAASEVKDAPRWEVVELWRVGGLEEGAELTVPAPGRVGPNGVLAIPDFAVGQVWLLDDGGRWLEPVGGWGQGPGELQNPFAASWAPTGELLVLDVTQAKIERYDLRSGESESRRVPGDLVGPVFASGQVGWFGLRGDGVVFLEFPSRGVDEDGGRVAFARAGPDDERHEVAWESWYPEDRVPAYDRVTLPEWPRALLATGSRGWAVSPSSDRYELILYDLSDEPRLHICVSDSGAYGRGGPDDFEVPEYMAAQIEALRLPERPALFSRLVLDQDDRLWIERELPQPGSGFDLMYGIAGAHLDILSSEGELVGRVKMPEGLRFQDARGDTVWAFSIGEFDEVEVVAGRLRRPI